MFRCFSYVYWTEWGANPRVARMRIGSSSADTVGPRNLKWPNGLFVKGDSLYVADGHPTRPRLFNCSLPGLESKELLFCHFVILNFFFSQHSCTWTDCVSIVRKSDSPTANLTLTLTLVLSNLRTIEQPPLDYSVNIRVLTL